MFSLDAARRSLDARKDAHWSRRRVLAGVGAFSLVAAAGRAGAAVAQSATAGASTPASPPAPEAPSKEATADQLALALQQGKAYGQALAAMEEEATVQHKAAGDFEVWLIAEKAEGLYILQDGTLHWTEPGDSNAHLEVAPRDAGDGRFVPGLDVSLTLKTAAGKDVGEETIPLVWHPWLYHYGKNWKVPGDGHYRATIKIAPFKYDRHDERNGKRYADPVEVEFDMEITTGQK